MTSKPGELEIKVRGRSALLRYGVDALEGLRNMPSGSIHCIVTSPPYWGLRDYGVGGVVWGGDPNCTHTWGDLVPGSSRGGSGTFNGRNGAGEGYGRAVPRGRWCIGCGAWSGQLGLEPNPGEYVRHIVEIFSEARRVLRDDGILWLNLGDSYSGSGGVPSSALKNKDLAGIPWRVAFALQDDGWWLRQDVVWAKPNCMPESVSDRCTRSHEYLFMLAKNEKYFYNSEDIKEIAVSGHGSGTGYRRDARLSYRDGDGKGRGQDQAWEWVEGGTRNRRSVWTIPVRPYSGAHFATFPADLAEIMVLSGTSDAACPLCGSPWKVTTRKAGLLTRRDSGDAKKYKALKPNLGESSALKTRITTTTLRTGMEPTCACEGNDGSGVCKVLDPFSGSGTTGQVALSLGRDYIGIDANAEYLPLAVSRIQGDAPPKSGGAPRLSQTTLI